MRGPIGVSHNTVGCDAQEEHMRNELKSALVVLAVAAVSNVWAGPKPLPKPITDAMAKFENALKWNSPVALRNLVFEYSMPEYTSTMMGQKLDLYGEVENTIMFGKMIEKVKKVDMKINGWKWNSPTSIDINVRMSGQMVMNMGKERVLATVDNTSVETWVNSNGNWRILRTNIIKEHFSSKPMKGKK